VNKNLLCLVMVGYIVSTFSMDEPINIVSFLEPGAQAEVMISDTHTCNIMPVYDAQIRINKNNRTIEMVSGEIKGLEKACQINLSKDLENEIMTKKEPFYFCISHKTSENGFTPISCTRITHVLMSNSTGYIVSTQLEDSIEITQEKQWIPSMSSVVLYFSKPFFLIYRYLFRS
jgi:hypothetical protein